ncbi:acetyl-CoA synthetase-like protein [Setomelanomma holmii]|uniref:Acetyl-CoA synthetase-like protein n=1 Tax=Setomelanomma holmii TaxID=210430 RepID=A0A9P4LT07_9PLEO|nr:acetyl-CoA synthetase-like protein [Setomelanomma holmii]
MPESSHPSLIHGPTDIPLWHKTIGALLEEQVQIFGDETAIVVPWQNIRCSFRDLQARSERTARALLATGIKNGDFVAVKAGNRIEYIDFVLAAARIGCPLVILNNTYTPHELVSALERTATKVLLIASQVGSRSLSTHIERTKSCVASGQLPHLKHIVTLPSQSSNSGSNGTESYQDFLETLNVITSSQLQSTERRVKDTDVVNVQFTSGSTGLPKAALLTHRNILNNGRFVGTRMHLTPSDIVCCPPPLFHCFGLVMGFLNTLSHGASIVFPSDSFDANLTLDAIASERCTALLGVPTMFFAQLECLASKPYKIDSVRVGLAAGAPVPISLQEDLARKMGVKCVLIAYGMTETSPVSAMMDVSDPPQRLKSGLGRTMPHNSLKIVDGKGEMVPRGTRGEICSSGYALMKGYLNNPEATAEAMRSDGEGRVWMHSGDEGCVDEDGYVHITGRIKDMIIRGGENIFPAEIEERLLHHPSIAEVSVVGLPDERYGEVVSAFVRLASSTDKPDNTEIQAWVGEALGRHKVPKWMFWVGEDGVVKEIPKTGSGKHQKHILREIGKKLLNNEHHRWDGVERARL